MMFSFHLNFLVRECDIQHFQQYLTMSAHRECIAVAGWLVVPSGGICVNASVCVGEDKGWRWRKVRKHVCDTDTIFFLIFSGTELHSVLTSCNYE